MSASCSRADRHRLERGEVGGRERQCRSTGDRQIGITRQPRHGYRDLFGGGDANLTPNCAVLLSTTASVLVRFVRIGIGTSLSIPVTLTSALVRLVPEARKTAVSFAISPSSAALIVTFWKVAKLADGEGQCGPSGHCQIGVSRQSCDVHRHSGRRRRRQSHSELRRAAFVDVQCRHARLDRDHYRVVVDLADVDIRARQIGSGGSKDRRPVRRVSVFSRADRDILECREVGGRECQCGAAGQIGVSRQSRDIHRRSGLRAPTPISLRIAPYRLH